MRGLALVVVLALSGGVARAEDLAPADRPVAVKAGQVVPVDGLLMPDAAAIFAARRLASCEAKVPVLEAGVQASPPWWVVPLVAVVALGVGAGVGLSVRR